MKTWNGHPNLFVDDWGLSKEINLATLELARRGVLGGVSLLSDSPHLQFKLERLLTFNAIKIGLHFNLTHPSIHWKRLVTDPHFVSNELSRQHQSLLNTASHVDYIDGHHHMHLLPLISRSVQKFAQLHEIPLRIIEDRSHFGSYILSKIFRLQMNSEGHFFCNYLTPRDLKNSSRFEMKLLQSPSKPLVVHVSTNCLASQSQASFEVFRTKQFIKLLEYLDGQ